MQRSKAQMLILTSASAVLGLLVLADPALAQHPRRQSSSDIHRHREQLRHHQEENQTRDERAKRQHEAESQQWAEEYAYKLHQSEREAAQKLKRDEQSEEDKRQVEAGIVADREHERKVWVDNREACRQNMNYAGLPCRNLVPADKEPWGSPAVKWGVFAREAEIDEAESRDDD